MKVQNLDICPVILTYNNSSILGPTSIKLADWGFPSSETTIIENGSLPKHKTVARQLASDNGFTLIDYECNRGWGGAINYYLDSYCTDIPQNRIFLFMAHDCYFTKIDLVEICSFFEDRQTIFVCPAYPNPVSSYYNLLRSFYSRSIHRKGRILIGHQTAFFARASHLKQVLYDEEFWVYGGEYEVFLRAAQHGFHSYQAEDTIIVNPGSGESSVYAYMSYKLNSLYYAYKRHGFFGLYLRASVLVLNIATLYYRKSYNEARLLSRILFYSLSNPGKGQKTYVESSELQARFKLSMLNH